MPLARRVFFLVFFGLLSVAALSACGPSVEQVCEDYALAWCSARFRCYQGDTLTAFEAMYGMTPAACALVQANGANYNCTGATPICAPGTSYDTGAGETCVSSTNMQGCPDIINSVEPPECQPSSVCH
jgi:hypothetical protein